VPIEEIIAHNEEIAEQLEHGELERSQITPPSLGAMASDHADAGAGTTGAGAGTTGSGGTAPAGGTPTAGSAGPPTAESAETGGPTTTGPARGEDAAGRRDPEEQA
jgi:hypothetical protein